MNLGSAIFIVVMSFITAAISGVFGMAGGLLLKGSLALVLPVSATFVVHGILQLVANGWRAILHRKHVDVRIVGIFALGAFAIGGVMFFIALEPTRATLFLLMGLAPFLVWLPDGVLKLDASRPAQAFICGLSVTGMNLTAGVAGPLLDIFFVRTALTRHQIVATKAATQVFSHIMKIVVYGTPPAAVPSIDSGIAAANTDHCGRRGRAESAERRELQALPAPGAHRDRPALPRPGGAALPAGLSPR